MSTGATPAPGRRRLLGPVPAPLALLLGAVAVFGLTWSLFVPPWQAPDELQHFAYAESLAQRFTLPGDLHRRAFSTAQALAIGASGAHRAKYHPAAAPPDWSASDFARYLAAARREPSASNGGGSNTASSNPPLYYLYADIAYAVSGGGNEFARLYAMRIWTLALLLVTTLCAWLLAGEVFGRRRLAQLTCAAITALMPMQTVTSSIVNPDALMIALWVLALWLGTRMIIGGDRRRDALALTLVVGAALVTKATSYALVPPVLLALLFGWLRRPRSQRLPVLSWFVIPTIALVAPVFVWIVIAVRTGRSPVNTISHGEHPRSFSVGRFLSFVWQFYLPRLPGMKPDREVQGLPLYTYWIKQAWGVFGWLSVSMPELVYRLLALVSAAIAVPAVVLLARVRGRVRLELLAFYATALLSLLALIHITDYRSLIAQQGAVVQGRYLLPLLPLFGLVVGLILMRLPRRDFVVPARAIHHVDLAVEDVERSIAFYTKLLGPLGVEVTDRFPTYRDTEEVAYLTIGEQALSFRKGDGGAHRYYEVGIEHFAIAVDTRRELDEAYQRCLELGATVQYPPQEDSDIPGYWACFVFDPDGFRLEILWWPGEHGATS